MSKHYVFKDFQDMAHGKRSAGWMTLTIFNCEGY
jgi:hypothetical protein